MFGRRSHPHVYMEVCRWADAAPDFGSRVQMASRLTWVVIRGVNSASLPHQRSCGGTVLILQTPLVMSQTHIHHVLMDASGSMQNCYDATLAALNSQIASLRAVQAEHPDQDVRFSISDFSNDYRMWFAPKSIGEIHDISEEQYQLRGSTALWDGLGTLITRTVDHIGADAPAKGTSVSIMVLTDGFENASRIFSPGALRLLIDNLTEKGWEFRFMGADIDPLEVSRELGFDARRTARFSKQEMHMVDGYMADEVRSYLHAKKR